METSQITWMHDRTDTITMEIWEGDEFSFPYLKLKKKKLPKIGNEL